MRTLLRVILYGFAVVGFLGIAFIGLAITVAVTAGPDRPDLPEQAVLDLEIAGPVAEQSDRPFPGFGERTMSLHRIVRTLERAAQDDRVAAIVMRLGGAELTLSQAQEIRDALRKVSAQDKPVLAFADSFGLGDRLSSSYYLATGAREIWLQPSGDVGLVGIALEVPFLRDALTSIGVEPEFEKRAEYKNAIDFLAESRMTEPNREALDAVAVSWLSQVVVGIGEGRGLSGEEVRRLVDRGPFTADQALAERLVDQLGYWGEAEAQAISLAGVDAELFPAAHYLDAAGPDPREVDARVALVMAEGPIVRGESGIGPFDGDRAIGAETYAEALRDAVEDDSIKGIILRINSPGGSYVASDTLWHEVMRAREAGKPVIATMADVAGSGGYFLAMAADTVIAQPATLTGSIGTFGGKVSLSGLWETLGVNWGMVEAGQSAGMYSPNRPFSAAQRRKLSEQLDRVYADFTAKAAEARGMSLSALQSVAKGRVWTGADARRRDLVDALGGLSTAVALMEERLDISPERRLEIVSFPRHRSPVEELAAWFTGEASVFADLGRLSVLVERLDPLLAMLQAVLAVGSEDRRMLMPHDPRP